MGAPKVSIITPTFNRERFLPLAHRCFLSQTYPDLEWLVLDDSPAPSAYLRALSDPRIRYHHSGERFSIGRKRNRLIAEAAGDIIVQFDDDDYYSPRYVARMVARLNEGFDLVKLSGWFLYSVPYRSFGYWDLTVKEGRHHRWSPQEGPPTVIVVRASTDPAVANNHLGYGFSYVFRKKVWEAIPFSDDAHWNEDTPFAVAADKAFRLLHFKDRRGLCLHILHEGNISRSFPQYRLPSFLLRWFFSARVRDYVAC